MLSYVNSQIFKYFLYQEHSSQWYVCFMVKYCYPKLKKVNYLFSQRLVCYSFFLFCSLIVRYIQLLSFCVCGPNIGSILLALKSCEIKNSVISKYRKHINNACKVTDGLYNTGSVYNQLGLTINSVYMCVYLAVFMCLYLVFCLFICKLTISYYEVHK